GLGYEILEHLGARLGVVGVGADNGGLLTALQPLGLAEDAVAAGGAEIGAVGVAGRPVEELLVAVRADGGALGVKRFGRAVPRGVHGVELRADRIDPGDDEVL